MKRDSRKPRGKTPRHARRNHAMAARRVKMKTTLDIELAEQEMRKRSMDDDRYTLLRYRISEALDVMQRESVPASAAVAELVKFTAALDLKANGPAATVIALRGLAEQIETLTATNSDLARMPVDGNA